MSPRSSHDRRPRTRAGRPSTLGLERPTRGHGPPGPSACRSTLPTVPGCGRRAPVACRRVERRIFGLENEYGVTCTLRGQRRLSPDEVARYLFRRVVSWGRQQQRLPGQRCPALPRRGLAPRVRHARVRLDLRPGRARQGGRAHPRAAPGQRRAAAARRGHPRRHLPVQEQHRLGRQQLRLPRELPHQPPRRLRHLRRGAHPVPGQPPDLRRRRQGAADRAGRHVLRQPAGRAHLGGHLERHHPLPARSSTPATSPTPTPSATAGCT